MSNKDDTELLVKPGMLLDCPYHGVNSILLCDAQVMVPSFMKFFNIRIRFQRVWIRETFLATRDGYTQEEFYNFTMDTKYLLLYNCRLDTKNGLITTFVREPCIDWRHVSSDNQEYGGETYLWKKIS